MYNALSKDSPKFLEGTKNEIPYFYLLILIEV